MDKKELTLTRTFDAPLELVWKAWTDQELVSKWWGPNGVTNPTCEIDATPGGIFHIVMLAGADLGPMAGQKWPMLGSFTEVQEPEKLVITSSALDEHDQPFIENTFTVTFKEVDQKTTVTVHVEVTKAAESAKMALQGMEMGWNQQLDKLVQFVASN
jgi:uncharacterized protein YndB with AHSA1/START domain